MTTATLPYRVLTTESNTNEWLAARQAGVGASESAAVLGESAWGTPYSIWQQKCSDTVTDETTDLMEFGHLAESLVVEFITRHPERFGWMGTIIETGGVWQSIEHPFLLASLDRQVLTLDGLVVPLEIKSVNDFQAADWKVGGDGQADAIEQSDPDAQYEVPLKYQIQVQQQMAVTGAPFGYVAVWLGKGVLVVIRVERDQAFIDEYLVGKVGDFWAFYVESRTPPPLSLNDDLWAAIPGDPELEPLQADTELVDLIGQWRIATTDNRDLEKEIKRLKFDIATRMGDHEQVTDPATGEVIHTLKGQNGRRGTDYPLLEAQFPEAYKACVTPAGRHRVHRATKASI